jgi:hypothetical protein
MARFLSRRRTLGIIVLIILNLLCFGLLSPLESPTVVLFAAFGLLATDFFVCMYAFLRTCQRLFNRPKQPAKRPALIATGVIILLLALQSVGQLGPKDILAVLLLCGIAYFYLSYYRTDRS